MRYVRSPVRQPQRCAFLPTIRGFHPKGFIEGTELWGGDTAYISVEAVQEIASGMGWVPRNLETLADRRAKNLQDELDSARLRIQTLERELEAYRTVVQITKETVA